MKREPPVNNMAIRPLHIILGQVFNLKKVSREREEGEEREGSGR